MPQFDEFRGFENGPAFVALGNRMAYVNRNGEPVRESADEY